jgi:hypothetical protein
MLALAEHPSWSWRLVPWCANTRLLPELLGPGEEDGYCGQGSRQEYKECAQRTRDPFEMTSFWYEDIQRSHSVEE